jgi:regulation of enolase protein 1 (concanavalin A-like superfamily)
MYFIDTLHENDDPTCGATAARTSISKWSDSKNAIFIARLLLGFVFAWLLVGKAFAYDVWIGTHQAPHAAAVDTGSWSRTAALLDGINVNRAPHDTDPATTADWRTIIAQFNVRNSNSLVEMARSQPTRDATLVNEALFPKLDAELAQIFNEANVLGYKLKNIMFYDNALNRTNPNGAVTLTNYNWTVTEVQHMRNWLDANGHASVGLIWDARSNSPGNRAWIQNPLVDHVMIEANANALITGSNGLHSLISWLWSEPTLRDKKIIFQIARGTPGASDQFVATRRALHFLGTNLMGFDFMRSDRVVFLPVNYNLVAWAWGPETVNPNQYGNSLTGLTLSLLEQQSLWEGRGRVPTIADADSFARGTNTAPSINPIGNKVVNESTLLSFRVTAVDPDIPAQTLTYSLAAGAPAGVSITSAGVFSWTPTESQGPGTYRITVRVSDGIAADTASFDVTVNEVNVAPVLALIGNKSVTKPNTLGFTATASDSDIPAQTQTFSLTLGNPAATGATITPSGTFTWTPSAALPNGTYPVTITVSDGVAKDSETIQIQVSAPALAPLAPTGLSATAGDAQITLSWNASANATSYTVKRATGTSTGLTTIASGVNGNSYLDKGLTNGTTYRYVVVAVNAVGSSSDSTSTSATPSGAPGVLPSPWQTRDIGSPLPAGSATFSNGIYTLTGGGTDMWKTSDEFRFVHQGVNTNNFTITAKVISLPSNIHPFTKAGVVVRDTLSANSINFAMMVTAGSGASFQSRTTTGGLTTSTKQAGFTAPLWVRITRAGNTFTGYQSVNGTTWTQVAKATLAIGAGTHVGLAVTSHENGTPAQATFSNVTITQ